MKSWELSNFCEIDKYAVKSYCAIHKVDPVLNLGDITKVDETTVKSFTMICGGSPCQDFSVAGKLEGSFWMCKTCGLKYNPLLVHHTLRRYCPKCYKTDIDKTRSSLLVEFLRFVKHHKPKFGIYENVKNIVGKRFRHTTFKVFCEELQTYGYNVYWKVLNAKNYGIPQNRERVFVIFIRKDIDNKRFDFPKGFDSGVRLGDVLEDEVDEKYYISNDKVQWLLTSLNSNDSLLYNPCQVKREGKLRDYKDSKSVNENVVNENVVKQVGNISDCDGNWKNPQVGRFYDSDGCSSTLTTNKGDVNNVNKIAIKQATKKGYIECVLGGVADLSYPNSKTRRGRVQGNGNICPTITATETNICRLESLLRIRKLTPKECFRLMGFADSAYELASKNVSNSQLYKQAGNSIVVDILYYIFVELYKAMPYLFDDLKLSSFFSGIGAFEYALNRLYESINTGNFTKPQVEK